MSLFEFLLEQPFIFNLSQLPFTRQKFARIVAHTDLSKVKRILDVGCGPGTNAPSFAHAEYLGIDINPRYIQLAKKRFRRDFLVADATSYSVPADSHYDFILVNSFLHHIDTPAVSRILGHLSTLLSPNGFLHCVELVLPDHPGLPRTLARMDRGRFARPLHDWQNLFQTHLETDTFEPFSIVHFGCAVMDLVYFKGRVRQ
jgi:2-polyprenyl-3-methyl-5-hydroxy-6-metoxy-1,4-benzoquinol methylase